MVAMLVALGLEWARAEPLQSPSEVEQWLELPVLGSIPALQQPGQGWWKRILGARGTKPDEVR